MYGGKKMIGSLHIKNVGIIDELNINLNEGFNVFTGETGAGKTLIIDSLQVLAGGRFSKEIIRHGEKSSFIEMLVYLGEEEYIISREVNLAGRNICKINGRLVTVNELKLFMKKVLQFLCMFMMVPAIIMFFMALCGLNYVEFNSLIFWRNLSIVLISVIVIWLAFNAARRFE